MNRRPWRLCCVLLALGIMGKGSPRAEEPQVTATANPARVEEGSEIQLVIEIKGSSQVPDEPPDLTQLPGFVVAAGPSVSSYFQWINGQTRASRTYTYTLLPQGIGPRTLPPLLVRLGGSTYRTNPVRVDVVSRGALGGTGGVPSPPSSPFADPGLRRRLAPPPTMPASLSVEAAVDKSEVYPGEQVTLTYRVYTQFEIVQLSLKDQPAYPGFWVEELKTEGKYTARAVTREEGTFTEYTVLRKALFPTNPGTLSIPPLTFHLAVRRRGMDPFDSFFFPPTESLFRSTQPLSIRVKPLPEQGRPSEFSGAVGRFTLSVDTDRRDTRVNDAVALKIRVEGQGNINTLARPSLPPLHDFKQYEPKVAEAMEAKGGTLVGEKTWDYVLIPLAPGRQEIPPVRFAFFDPQTAQYRVLESDRISLNVAKGDLAEVPIQPGPERSEIPVLGADIRYIKLAGSPIVDQGRSFYGSRGFFALLVAPLLLNTSLLVVRRHRAARAGKEASHRRRRARRMAHRRLARARTHLSHEQSRHFYQELASALTAYLADKLSVPASGLTYDRIEEMLAGSGVDPAARQKFRSCLETCDFARFAPTSSERAEMERALTEAGKVIETLEGTVRVS